MIFKFYLSIILDFDNDGYLNQDDLLSTVKHLTHDLLAKDEYSAIVEKASQISLL